MNPVIEQIKIEALNSDVCETILAWADKSFDQMMSNVAVEYKYYDTTSMLIPGTARSVEDDVWLVGYRFTIAVSFSDENDIEVSQDSMQCFLVIDRAKNIVQYLEETQIDSFSGTTELH